MEDFNSLAGRSPATDGRHYKYLGSYEGLGAVLRRHCPAYPEEAEKLFLRILINYALGNGDAHLKNFSFFTSPDGYPVLTPAYDLVNTTLHLPNETPLALDLFDDDELTAEFQVLGFQGFADFSLLGDRLGLVPKRTQALISRMQDPALWQNVEALIECSFLSLPVQEA